MDPHWRPPSPAQPFYGAPQARSTFEPLARSAIAQAQAHYQTAQPFHSQPVAGPSSYNPALNAVPLKRQRTEQLTDDSGKTDEDAPKGPKSEKSCKACRQRKVKCSRTWPRCERCIERDLACEFSSLVPVGFVNEMLEDNRLSSIEQRLHSLEALRHSPKLPLAEDLTAAVTAAYFSGTAVGGELDGSEEFYADESLVHACSSQGMMDDAAFEEEYGPDGISWRLSKTVLARSLTVHLVRSFFASCCSHMPTFKPWHSRIDGLCENVDSLEPAMRTAVFVFSALGARASPHSALLNLDQAQAADAVGAGLNSAGTKREVACRALQDKAFEFSHKFGLEHDSTIQNLEILLLLIQIDELVPRRNRTLVRIALGHFTEIQDDPNIDEQVKVDTAKRLGMALVAADALIAAYARKAPLATKAVLAQSFSALTLPDLSTAKLTGMVGRFIDLSNPGAIVHERLGAATAMLYVWLLSCQRQVATLSALKRCEQADIRALWSNLDELHSCVQKLQDIVIHLERPPAGCAEMDGIHDLHMRFATRTHRESVDVTLLLHSLIHEREPGSQDEHALRQESFERVRRALKLAAFYFELYITSSDPHQAYHLAFELELLPDWVEVALQRYGEPGGPATEELELTETELDWIERGLGVTTFYHVLAERRLAELVVRRRPQREGTNDSRATPAMSTHRFNPAMKAMIASADENSAWPRARAQKHRKRSSLGLPTL